MSAGDVREKALPPIPLVPERRPVPPARLHDRPMLSAGPTIPKKLYEGLLSRIRILEVERNQREDEIARTRQENQRLRLEVQHYTSTIEKIASALDAIFTEFLSTRQQSHLSQASILKDIIKIYRSSSLCL
jgi:hypothetical protein